MADRPPPDKVDTNVLNPPTCKHCLRVGVQCNTPKICVFNPNSIINT